MIIIPAIDLIDGRCVRLQQGDFNNLKSYSTNPAAVAESYREAGLTNLHLVDLDGAKLGKLKNTSVLIDIAQRTDLKIDWGGRIKTLGDVEMLFSLGAYAVNLGSVAVKNPEMMKKCLEKYGGEKIILSADVNGESIMIRGWQDNSGVNIYSLIESFVPYGLKRACVTSISRDGMLTGPDFELYLGLMKKFPNLKFTASGGVSSTEDLKKLADNGLHSVIVGKAIYENKISVADLSKNY